MAKEDKKNTKEDSLEKKDKKADIVIEETEDDVALGTEFIGDSEDLKKAVKRESEKGKLTRVLVPLFFFAIIGAIIGYATWYYTRPERTESTKTVEEKIQTPPVIEEDKLREEDEDSKEEEIKEEEGTSTEESSSSSSSADYISYTVKSGDTLSGIANDHGLTSSELADYNNITDVHSLQIGQTIKIPQ